MTVDEKPAANREQDSGTVGSGRSRAWIRAGLARWRVILIVGLTAVAVGLAAGVYAFQYRPDQQIDATAAATAKKAAEDGTIAVLSYSPQSLSDDITNAKSYLTGDFLTYYTHFTDQIFAAAARQQQVTTTARVERAAVSELRPDSAVVLLFVNKESSSKDKPAPVTKPTTVRATMKRVNGSWLIAQFEPL
jgi:Mce-associated membrane protein